MFRATHTPSFNFLVDDLLTRDTAKIAAHISVTVQTLKRWQLLDHAPRSVLLALFFESRWGLSQLYTEAFNNETFARQHARILERENAALRLRIERLERLGDFGAANAPTLQVVRT